MAQKRIQDEWGTGAREGYEDRGAFRPPRAPQKEPGSPLLRILGAIAIVAGILMLIMPRLLNYIVAIYLIFIGIVGLNSVHHFFNWH